MAVKKSLRSKILTYTILPAIVLFTVAIGYIGIRFRRVTLLESERSMDAIARGYSNESSLFLESYMEATRVLASAFEGYREYDPHIRRKVFARMIYDVLDRNKYFHAIWTIWEPNSIDGMDSLFINAPGCTRIGNFATTYYKSAGQILLENSGIEGELFVGDYYTVPKSRKKETIMDAYSYSYTGNPADAVLMTSTILPIMDQGKFLGVIGIDASIEVFQEVVSRIKPYPGSFSFLLDNGGNFVAHQEKTFIGKSVGQVYPVWEKEHSISKQIKNGNFYSYTARLGENEVEYYVTISPISIGETEQPWALGLVVPMKMITARADAIFTTTLIIGVAGILFFAGIVLLIAGSITRPLDNITALLRKLNKADLKELSNLQTVYHDEIGDIAHSAYTLIEWLNRTGAFAREIKEGHYDASYELISQDDVLGRSLIDLRDRLLANRKEEERIRLEEQRRNWTNTGLAKFSDLLRFDSSLNLADFSYNVLSNLVDYLGANQGGIFVVNSETGDSPCLELTASYAYNVRKFKQLRVAFGEGLVGICALERKMTYMTRLPENYIEITSGLGQATPRNLLLVPMIFNSEVLGVVEIASFSEIEQYKIDFVQKLSESMASTLSALQITQRTNRLLNESNAHSREMIRQEEELRQNLEELRATQEDLARSREAGMNREHNMQTLLDSLPDALLVVGRHGNVVFSNFMFRRLVGHPEHELARMQVTTFFHGIEPESMEEMQWQPFSFRYKQGETKQVHLAAKRIERDGSQGYLLVCRIS